MNKLGHPTHNPEPSIRHPKLPTRHPELDSGSRQDKNNRSLFPGFRIKSGLTTPGSAGITPRGYHRATNPGFTIVELLIVIVVIGILAAITIVAYNGVTSKAREASLISNLKSSSTLLEMDNTFDGSYPSDANSANQGKGLPTGIAYTQLSGGSGYCIEATATINGIPTTYYLTNTDQNPKKGDCATNGSGTLTMQNFTSSDCSALTTYTGSNSGALITLHDPRGPGADYTVGKLADGNCWMLDNLKLGSTVDTITLTPSDSNVAGCFVLPSLITGGTAEYDNPRAYGQVPGDTGSGETNYGYLYNWPAATAGEDRTHKPAGSASAAYDICPKNWRLPTGDLTGELAWLAAKMHDPYATEPLDGDGFENWDLYSDGPFRGVAAGEWWSGSMMNQSAWMYVWTGTPHTVNLDDAFILTRVEGTYPGTNYARRGVGASVRCLLK